MALALRMDAGAKSPGFDTQRYVFAILSDGEHDEGNLWEGVMLAGKNKLHNLIAIVDRNNIQIDGFTEDVMPLEPLRHKWEAFNWHVQEIDGHSFQEINLAVTRAKAVFEKPSVIIARTIPGKGVHEIEHDYRWHGAPPGAGPEDVWPKSRQASEMLKELRTLGGKIRSEHQ